MRPIYLDNNATTRADPGVVAEMLPYFSEFFGNASSQHGYGAPVAAAVRSGAPSLAKSPWCRGGIGDRLYLGWDGIRYCRDLLGA